MGNSIAAMIRTDRLPASLFVRAGARRIKDCAIVWVNKRALSDACGHLEDDFIREFVLSNYAYELAPINQRHPATQLLVDRYGTTGVKRYGGSGRAGSINGIQVKGIGATPLVDPLADASHSHGRLSLKEAIKECLFSELASRMFPIGAVESLAVIRLGRYIEYPDGRYEEAALLIRPFVLRPSHLQRAVGFVDARTDDASHKIDVLRVKQAIAWVEQKGENNTLSMFVRNLGEQVAYCHLYRWFGGGALSSNYSLDGKMLDFGAANIVPSWRRHEFNSHGPAFGDEERFCTVMIDSLSFYFRKFGTACQPTVGALLEVYRQSYERTLVNAMAAWLGIKSADLPEKKRAVCAAIFREAFGSAQIAKCDDDATMIEAESVYKICHALDVAAPAKSSWLALAGFRAFSAAEVERKFGLCDQMTSDSIREEMCEFLTDN